MNTNTASAPAMTTAPMPEWFTVLSADLQAALTSMVNEEGYPLDDIADFIEQYGAQAYSDGHYVTWCELSETGADESAIEAYVEEVGIECIGGFEESYVGEYGSEADFAREFFEGNYNNIDVLEEAGVVIDWQATWDSNLCYNYAYNNGYVFNTNV
jgi:hypothetical protein